MKNSAYVLVYGFILFSNSYRAWKSGSKGLKTSFGNCYLEIWTLVSWVSIQWANMDKWGSQYIMFLVQVRECYYSLFAHLLNWLFFCYFENKFRFHESCFCNHYEEKQKAKILLLSIVFSFIRSHFFFNKKPKSYCSQQGSEDLIIVHEALEYGDCRLSLAVSSSSFTSSTLICYVMIMNLSIVIFWHCQLILSN